jgi:hypothetical protein
MIELRNDALVFSFPEVHPHAVLEVEFQRTLRIPDDDSATRSRRGWGASRCVTWTTMRRGCRRRGCGEAVPCCRCTRARRCG